MNSEEGRAAGIRADDAPPQPLMARVPSGDQVGDGFAQFAGAESFG